MSRSHQIELIVHANRILFDQGVLDAFGHVSVRSEDDPTRFFLARKMPPSLVGTDDVMEFDLSGNSEDPRPSYLERYIHSEIYRRSPDVHAVVHSHASSVVPFTVVSVPLRPVFHMAGFLAGGAQRFDIRDHFGDGTDLLIRSGEMGAQLAQVRADAPIVLMRGHGMVAVGRSVQEAVYRSVFTAQNAAMQSAAMQLGEPTYLSHSEGFAAMNTMATEMKRAWDMWTRESGIPTPSAT